MLNEVRIIGRVQHAIPARSGHLNGLSFTVWTGILVRVSIPRGMDRLRTILTRRTLVYVEGELCPGGSVWARRVIVLADVKPRHLGLAFQDGPPANAVAEASSLRVPDDAELPPATPVDPGPPNGVLCPFHGERCPGKPYCLGA